MYYSIQVLLNNQEKNRNICWGKHIAYILGKNTTPPNSNKYVFLVSVFVWAYLREESCNAGLPHQNDQIYEIKYLDAYFLEPHNVWMC